MALTTPVHGTVYSPPPRSVQQPALPSAAGHAAAAATLRCLSATPHLQHPQSNNGGYRAYSAMIHYCSAGYSPCDSMTLPPPTPLPLLTPSSGPLRPPTYFPPTYSQPGPSYKLQTTAEKCFANKSQEAANALLSLQREPVVMPACSQPHPSEPDLSQDLLQENARGISDSSLNVSEAPCSHPDLHMGSLSPPVLSHCNSEGVSPPTLTSLPHGAHAYGPTTPFPTPAIGSLLTHFQPTNYSYLPFTPHELFGGSYICHICGKSYVRPATLRSHVKSHSGEKPYQCSICHKSFTQATNLTAHLRTHSGEKPFTCRVCHRGFSQSSSVTTHMRTHSGDRPYKCNVCNKGFADSSTLTKHYRTHTGEKPYQCKICEARFSQSGNLNRHMRTHRHFPMESSSK